MNERIKELEKQCWDHQSNCVDTEKFAYLIVRECMKCSTWVGEVNNNPVEPIHTAHAINKRISKLFGVEE